MNLRRFHVVGLACLVLELALAAWGLARTAADAVVPIHWNVEGVPDGFGPALFAFLMVPGVTLAILVLMTLLPRIEPRRENLRLSAGAYRTVAVAVVLFLGMVHAIVVVAGTGREVPVGLLVGGGVGVVLAVIGNVLTTVRSTFLFGVRTPWTLSSERSWDRTHRLVGRLFVVTGSTMVLVALTGRLQLVMAVLIVMLVVTLVGGTWYSYRVWRDDPERRPAGSAR